mgnify:CR=1 FL=1
MRQIFEFDEAGRYLLLRVGCMYRSLGDEQTIEIIKMNSGKRGELEDVWWVGKLQCIEGWTHVIDFVKA